MLVITTFVFTNFENYNFLFKSRTFEKLQNLLAFWIIVLCGFYKTFYILYLHHVLVPSTYLQLLSLYERIQ